MTAFDAGSLPEGWMSPDWPVPANVRAVFTGRAGGVSVPPWDSFNLGDHVGDTGKDVLENRKRLQQVIGAKAVFLQQVHGVDVLKLSPHTLDGSRADACVTSERGLACTIMVADCLPVLLATRDGTAIAAAHAGWRGLAGAGQSAGVLETTHAALVANCAEPPDIIAWLGPCIGPAAFEVGSEVRSAFESTHAEAAACFKPYGNPRAGKYLADLPALARLRLDALGVSAVYGNDGTDAWCTVRHPSRFFSHRRDAGSVATTGRMAACIWLD